MSFGPLGFYGELSRCRSKDALRTHTYISAIVIESDLFLSLRHRIRDHLWKELGRRTCFRFFMVGLLCILFVIVTKIHITDDCAAIYHHPSHLRKSWTEDITIQAKATSYRSNRGYRSGS